MLECKNLNYAVSETPIITDFSATIKAGQHTLLLGASGSGKTTLLHLMAGLLSPTSGEVHVDATVLSALPAAKRDAFRGQQIGMIFQTLHLVRALCVADNLRLARTMAGLAPDEARLYELLEAVNLADKAKHFPHQLSTGQAQRAAVARAMMNRPRWILADEPTSALDDAHAEQTLQLLLKQTKEAGATLLVATHDARIKPHFTQQIVLGSPATTSEVAA